MMDKELFAEKIRLLNDDRLRQLLQLRTKGNHEIMELAETEATRRGISTDDIEPMTKDDKRQKTKNDEGTDWMLELARFLSEQDPS